MNHPCTIRHSQGRPGCLTSRGRPRTADLRRDFDQRSAQRQPALRRASAGWAYWAIAPRSSRVRVILIELSADPHPEAGLGATAGRPPQRSATSRRPDPAPILSKNPAVASVCPSSVLSRPDRRRCLSWPVPPQILQGVRAGYVDLADGFDVEHKPQDLVLRVLQRGKGPPLEVLGVGEESGES